MANACQLNRPATAVPYTDAQAEAYAREVGAVPRPQETKNEIDVMLMRGVVPVFVSCKNGAVKMDELYKLDTVAQRFGGR